MLLIDSEAVDIIVAVEVDDTDVSGINDCRRVESIRECTEASLAKNVDVGVSALGHRQLERYFRDCRHGVLYIECCK